MGSQLIQGHLWGQRANDWATIQEPTARAGYEYALRVLQPTASVKILDIGCGSGFFANLAAQSGAIVTGLDATEPLIEEAKLRNPSVNFLTGEMEELPFDDRCFDIVCGFNSFQYAADIPHALQEARRVLKDNGKIAVIIWGNKEDCEAATYLKALGSLMPPPPPGAPGPFALSENKLLETMLDTAGFIHIRAADVPSIWDYPDTGAALKGLLSAGPAAKAIDHNSYEKAYEVVSNVLQPYIQDNGHVVYHNTFRVVTADK